MRIVEYCWRFLKHSPWESHLSGRWFVCFVIQCSTLFKSCTIGFLLSLEWFPTASRVPLGSKPHEFFRRCLAGPWPRTDKKVIARNRPNRKTWALFRKQQWGIPLIKTRHATWRSFWYPSLLACFGMGPSSWIEVSNVWVGQVHYSFQCSFVGSRAVLNVGLV